MQLLLCIYYNTIYIMVDYWPLITNVIHIKNVEQCSKYDPYISDPPTTTTTSAFSTTSSFESTTTQGMQTTTFNNQVRWATFDAWTYSLDCLGHHTLDLVFGLVNETTVCFCVIRLRISCQGKLCQDSSFHYNNSESSIPLQFSFQISLFYWSTYSTAVLNSKD